MSAIAGAARRTSGDGLRRWLPAALSAAGALGLSLYLALRHYQVDIDVYRMGGQHALLPDLYSVQFGKSGLFFTYTPFAALVFAFFGLNLGIWPLQLVWAVTNIVALTALIYLSVRIVVPTLPSKYLLRLAFLLLLPALALNPVFNTVGLGQINLVLCLLITWDLGTDRRIGSRTLPLGVATGLAAAIKLTPLIFVPYLVITRRGRGALSAVITFVACGISGFLITPIDSWTYWTKDVLNSKRAGALLYTSDQNVSSVLQRFHHAPVPGWVLVPALIVVGVGGVALAVGASEVISCPRPSCVRYDRADHLAHHGGAPHGVGGACDRLASCGSRSAEARPATGRIHGGAVCRRSHLVGAQIMGGHQTCAGAP